MFVEFLVVAIFIIFFIIVILLIVMSTRKPTDDTESQPCSTLEIPDLFPIPESQPSNCLVNNVNMGYYYIGKLDLTVSTVPTDYTSVCSKYCVSYINDTCTGNTDKFNECINNLKKIPQYENCTGIMPVASKTVKGTDLLFYPFAPSDLICDQSTPT